VQSVPFQKLVNEVEFTEMRSKKKGVKNSSFGNFGLQVGSCDLQMCCFWVGFLSSCAEEKQNKLPSVSSQGRFPSNRTIFSTGNQLNKSCFS